MARDIIINPNRDFTGTTTHPEIRFSGLTGGSITLKIEDNGSLTFEGTTGGLFSIEDDKDGLLHGVSDVSGLPILSVYSDNRVEMGKWDDLAMSIIDNQTFIGPSATTTSLLHISGGTLTYFDGNEGANKVLSSNTSGIASWNNSMLISEPTSANTNTISGGVSNSVVIGVDITASSSNMLYATDITIDGLTSTDPLATDSSGKIIAGASDSRLKQNITNLTGGLEMIQNLRGVSYEWTKESNMGGGIRYGLIAQEVQDVVPDMVRKRAKGDGMLTLNYNEMVPWLIEAVKEMSSDDYVNTVLETQTISAEDNNIELNYGGNHESSIGGGLTIKDGIKDGSDSFIKIDESGRWIIGPSLTTTQLTLPEYTPNSSYDDIGGSGDIVWDDNYLYLRTNNGWRRSSLEIF